MEWFNIEPEVIREYVNEENGHLIRVFMDSYSYDEGLCGVTHQDTVTGKTVFGGFEWFC